MTVDLLVVSYNTKDKLKRFLDTIHKDYEEGIWKLYIAENDSQDGTQEWLIENAEDYIIEEIRYNRNIGYAGAINDLAFRSNSEFLCALNADTWFSTHHVIEAMESFRQLPNAAIIGPKQMDEQNRIRHGGIFWDGIGNPIHRAWGKYDPHDQYINDLQQCWTVSGSIYYVRRSAWDRMTSYPPYRELFPDVKGAFLPTPHYFEETFCSQLAHHLGYEVWYDGRVETAGHSWHASNNPGDNNDNWSISRGLYIETCNRLGIPHECR